MSNNGKILYVDQSVIDTYDSETTLLFPLKESEAIALLAFVEYFNWKTRWRNLTMTDEELFAFTASVADGLMNPIEGDTMLTEQQICDAIECGILKVSSRILSGDPSNTSGTVTIGDDGTITIGDGAGGGLPSTASAQRLAMGTANYVEGRIAEYLQDWEDFYSIQNPPTNTVMERLFSSKYLLDPVKLDASITEYINHRSGSTPPSWGVINLGREYYCRGASLLVTNDFMIDGGAVDDLLIILSMLDPLLQEQFDFWEADSGDAISDEYLNTACYRVSDQEWIVNGTDISGNTYTEDATGITTLDNRIYAIVFDGVITANDGRTWDGLYLNNSGTLSYLPMTLHKPFGGTATPQTTPAYEPNGYPDGVIYSVGVWEQFRRTNFPSGLTWSGQITMTLKDFGSNI